MPETHEHLAQYKHNKKLLESDELKKQSNADWAAVISFYSALHLLESFLSLKNIHCPDHIRRLQWLTTDSDLRKMNIKKSFLFLYGQSRRARYDCVTINSKDIKDVGNELNFIESVLIPKLGLSS